MVAVPQGKKMGLVMATTLVLVNMVGTGIFLLPVSMASIGSISTWGWVVGSIGAAAIGLMFAQLGAIDPKVGGPYAYARDSLGPYLGFQTNYVYWSANLMGNIAVATTVTGYFTELLPFLDHPAVQPIFTIGVIWAAVAINITGPRVVGFLMSWSTLLAMIPLVAIAVFGWFWFDAETFLTSWNPHHDSVWKGVSDSAAFALWAFMGVESAAVSANVIENPKRNVPLATLLGLVIATFLYVATCTVLLGIIPAEQLAASPAPFAMAAEKAVGPWGATVIAICAILKSGSSLVGWTLTIAQSALAAAKDGLFPKVFGWTDAKGRPLWNYLLSGVLMTLVVIVTISPNLTSQFNTIIDMAIILTVLPYMYTAVAFLRIRISDHETRAHHLGVIAVALIACGYCLWAVAGSDADLTRNAMILLFLSVPLYALFVGKKAADRAPTI